jgi:GNAT superfamily N-acetyltransferase
LFEIKEVVTQEDIKAIQTLFLEYAAWLDFPLCFQGFDKELATLPGKYSPPDGRLYLVTADGKYAGCIGLRKFSDGVCEMKRLYVKPAARGKGIEKALVARMMQYLSVMTQCAWTR